MSQMISPIRMISIIEFFCPNDWELRKSVRNSNHIPSGSPFGSVSSSCPLDASHPASAAMIVNGVAYVSTIHREYSCAGSQIASP